MALEFSDTTHEYISCGTGPNPSSENFSLVIWFYADNLLYQIPLDKLPSSDSGGWTIKARANNYIYWRIGTDADHDQVTVTNYYAANEWVCCAMTVTSGGIARIYKNGVLKKSQTGITRSVITTAINLCIGAPSTVSTDEAFDGRIAEVRLYDKTLSQNEITTIATLKGGDSIFDKLIGRWRLNEQAPGTTVSGTDSVIDQTGRYHGTPNLSPKYAESDGYCRSRRRAG